jgi:hypothetical protein
VSIRTTKHSLTFDQPFAVDGLDGLQPPGTYLVETDEELITDISFPAYRRTSTRLWLAPDPSRPGVVEVVEVNSPQIATALERSLRDGQ